MGGIKPLFSLMSEDADLLTAIKLFEQEQYELTEKKLQDFMYNYPNKVWPDSVYYLLGQTYYELGNYSYSQYFLNEITLRDNNKSLFYNAQLIIGQEYFNRNNYTVAMNYFRSITDNSNDIELLDRTNELIALCKDNIAFEKEAQRKKEKQVQVENLLKEANSLWLDSYVSEFTWTEVDSFIGTDGWQYYQWLIGIEFSGKNVDKLANFGEKGWMDVYKKIYILLNYEQKSAPWMNRKRFPYFTTNWAPTLFYLTIDSCENRFVLVPPTKSNGNQWEFYVDGIQKYFITFKEYYKKCLE